MWTSLFLTTKINHVFGCFLGCLFYFLFVLFLVIFLTTMINHVFDNHVFGAIGEERAAYVRHDTWTSFFFD